MFHRMKSESPQPQTIPQPTQQNPQQNSQAADEQKFTPPQTQARTEQSRPNNQPQPQQQKPQQQPAQAQAQQKQQQSNQQSNQQPSQQKEDAPAMTNNQTPNNNSNQPASGEDFSAPRALDIPVSPYQRPGQAPVRSGAGYPGAYPAAAYPAARPGAAPQAVAAGERKLTIGRGISISGEIESCDHLIVEGTVEAALKGASVLEIAENGTFYGTVDIDEATVAGRFEGDITVHGRLTIRSTGTITGSISYKELEVESGSVIDGRLTPVGAAAAENRSKNQKNNKKDHGKRDANNDDGLFSTKAAAE